MAIAKNKIDKLVAEREKLQSKASEEQKKVQQVMNALQIAETENMLENTTATNKKVEKFKKGLDKIQKELEETNQRISKVNTDIAEIQNEERKEEIKKHAQIYGEQVKEYKIHSILRNELDRLYRRASEVAGNGSPEPSGLKKMAHIKWNEKLTYEHGELKQEADRAEKEATEKAKKEAEEVLKELRELMERS